jgi:hypothetical protein
MKWATAVQHEQSQLVFFRALRALIFHDLSLSWGSALLHPRLYASTRFAGLGMH